MIGRRGANGGALCRRKSQLSKRGFFPKRTKRSIWRQSNMREKRIERLRSCEKSICKSKTSNTKSRLRTQRPGSARPVDTKRTQKNSPSDSKIQWPPYALAFLDLLQPLINTLTPANRTSLLRAIEKRSLALRNSAKNWLIYGTSNPMFYLTPKPTKRKSRNSKPESRRDRPSSPESSPMPNVFRPSLRHAIRELSLSLGEHRQTLSQSTAVLAAFRRRCRAARLAPLPTPLMPR